MSEALETVVGIALSGPLDISVARNLHPGVRMIGIRTIEVTMPVSLVDALAAVLAWKRSPNVQIVDIYAYENGHTATE